MAFLALFFLLSLKMDGGGWVLASSMATLNRFFSFFSLKLAGKIHSVYFTPHLTTTLATTASGINLSHFVIRFHSIICHHGLFIRSRRGTKGWILLLLSLIQVSLRQKRHEKSCRDKTPAPNICAWNAIALSNLTRHLQGISRTVILLNLNEDIPIPASFAITNLIILISNSDTLGPVHLEIRKRASSAAYTCRCCWEEFANRAHLYRHRECWITLMKHLKVILNRPWLEIIRGFTKNSESIVRIFTGDIAWNPIPLFTIFLVEIWWEVWLVLWKPEF